MERRTFSGAVRETTLAANISNVSSTITVTNASSFPTPPSADRGFVIVINSGHPDEEKVLISSRSGTTFTVGQRGFDGTIATSHSAGVTVDHILDANVMQDMNDTVYNSLILNWMGI